MPFDPTNEDDVTRLRDAMRSSFNDLKPFREHYHEYLREMVGVYWSSNGAKKVVPVNLLELASTIYLQNLMGAPPRVNASTSNRRIRPAGVKLAQVVNDDLASCEDGTNSVFHSLQRAVRSSIGTLGVVKIGLEAAGMTEVDGFQIYKNVPFVKHVHIDDWVQDMSARAIGAGMFEGHQFEVELDEAINNPEYDRLARKCLSAHEDLTKNFGGDERASALQGTKAAREPFKRVTQLWEIFLPKEQLLVTLSLDADGPALKAVPWDGPEHGPFHKLWYSEVDGNSMPLSPQHLWMGMHKIVNGLYRKLDRQSSRQKVVTAIQSQDEKDGQKIQKASDGDCVVLNNPAAAKEIVLGGVNQQNFAFMMQSRDLFSWLAGNLDTLGGLSAGSRTASQDEMLNQNSSQRISMMQQSVMLFTRAVLADYAYYLWKDPAQSYDCEIQIPGYGPIQAQLKPEERTHEFFEHNLHIEPYSMMFQTPAQRAAKIFQAVTGLLMPAQQFMQPAGISVDWAQLLKEYAAAMQIPELEACILQGGQPLDADSAQSDNPKKQAMPPAMPQQTTRNYNRTSQSAGPTRSNADSQMISQLMGGGSSGGVGA